MLRTVDNKIVSNINLSTSYKNDIKIYSYPVFKKMDFQYPSGVWIDLHTLEK